jgi:hypothetical protein
MQTQGRRRGRTRQPVRQPPRVSLPSLDSLCQFSSRVVGHHAVFLFHAVCTIVRLIYVPLRVSHHAVRHASVHVLPLCRSDRLADE